MNLPEVRCFKTDHKYYQKNKNEKKEEIPLKQLRDIQTQMCQKVAQKKKKKNILKPKGVCRKHSGKHEYGAFMNL
jgi:hypothetical protein